VPVKPAVFFDKSVGGRSHVRRGEPF